MDGPMSSRLLIDDWIGNWLLFIANKDAYQKQQRTGPIVLKLAMHDQTCKYASILVVGMLASNV
jgi:hypothetical protein